MLNDLLRFNLLILYSDYWSIEYLLFNSLSVLSKKFVRYINTFCILNAQINICLDLLNHLRFTSNTV